MVKAEVKQAEPTITLELDVETAQFLEVLLGVSTKDSIVDYVKDAPGGEGRLVEAVEKADIYPLYDAINEALSIAGRSMF